MEEIVNVDNLDKQQLYTNDRYALHKTFKLNYESMKSKNVHNGYSHLMEDMIQDLDIYN